MGDSQPTVYLEDIDPSYNLKSTSKRQRPDDAPQPGNSEPTPATAPVKRQRTLRESFFFQDKKKTSPLKGLKPSGASTSSVASDSSTRPKVASGLVVKLNSIPFSMTAYQESLSEDEKRLLQLECEVMGKSW